MSSIKKLQKLISTPYSLLLILLVILFIFRPYEPSIFYFGIWKVFLTATLMAAIFNCEHKRKAKKIMMIFAIPSLVITWINLFYEHETLAILFAIFTIWFLLICTSSILYDVVPRSRVGVDTLRGVVCAYFLIAFMFSYIFFLIEYIHPGSFSIHDKIVPVFPYAYYLSEMLYFSFVTLLTIGYGDIVGTSDVGQTAAVIEGIIGQFYIAILVARLVTVYTYALVANKKTLD